MTKKAIAALIDPEKDRANHSELMLCSLIAGTTTKHQKGAWIFIFRPSPRHAEMFEQGKLSIIHRESSSVNYWGLAETVLRQVESACCTYPSSELLTLRDALHSFRTKFNRDFLQP